ncbi:hypothetical protein KKG22_01165 [Patescibacteria group bacterium]|nr:hypothetical protein [Patescibacteria group bacterium]MBU1722044.1 hypothetical protein [Patescibacteria group bacterium]MBU1901514.1 hypothetical protein [Patescibacteria group bacterium]
MTWFIVALLGYTCLAVVFILDKFILDKSVSKPIVYTFYSTIFMFAALLAFPFGVSMLSGLDWIIALVAGVSFGVGLWWMFIALSIGETSHMSPFIGGIITIGIYALSSVFLGEHLTGLHVIGIAILAIASLSLSFEESNNHHGFHKGFLWGIAAALAFAVSHVATKHIYNQYDFLTGIVWTRAAIGFVGLYTLCFPSVYKTFTEKKKSKEKTTYATKHVLGLVVSDKILAVVGVILIQYAIALGSVTIVNAMAGIQFALMFIFIIILSKWAPKVFAEDFTKRELVIEWVGILLVIAGSVLFVI